MTPLEVMVYILGPIWLAAGVYAVFLTRELDELRAQGRENHPTE